MSDMTGKTAMDSHELKKLGLKATQPRLRIIELLERTDRRHVTAEDVYRMLLDAGDDIGLATIYRVLTQFEAAGLVTRHHFESGQAVFEVNRGRHHDHVVCLQCGRIEEFVDETIEARQREIAARCGFDLAEHALILYGNCRKPRCPNRKS
jgi:Fur family ferric uptake transcriptional regulator